MAHRRMSNGFWAMPYGLIGNGAWAHLPFFCIVLFLFILFLCFLFPLFFSYFETFWLHLGASWLQLGAFWLHLGASWLHLGASWLHLGAAWLPKKRTQASSNKHMRAQCVVNNLLAIFFCSQNTLHESCTVTACGFASKNINKNLGTIKFHTENFHSSNFYTKM